MAAYPEGTINAELAQAFRFNHRKDRFGNKLNDAARFTEAMQHIVGRRLTYSQLTGKSDSPHSPETGAGGEEAF